MTNYVRNFRWEVKDGKTYITMYNDPQYIRDINGEWIDLEVEYADAIELIRTYVNEEDIDPALLPKYIEYRDTRDAFYLSGELPNIIVDTDNPEILDAWTRNDSIREIEQANGIQYPRECIWVDGAPDITGIIILPHDDYSQVYTMDDDGTLTYLNEYTEGMERPYYIKENGKTYMYVNHFSGGAGTQADPYRINTPADFDNIRLNKTAYYKFMNDIDMTGYPIQPIADSGTFSGTVDGNGYSLINVVVDYTKTSATYSAIASIFGKGGSATIRNLKIVNPTITAVGASVSKSGIIFGGSYPGCTLDKVGIEGGSLTALVNCGSFFGEFYTGAAGWTITNCYSTATINGTSNIGGIFGYYRDQYNGVTNCYFAGDVNASVTGGYGFTGSRNTGTYNNCFWDTQTSVATDVAGSNAVGKTTAQMQTQATFTGWSFATTWYMDGYPKLQYLVPFTGGTGVVGDPYIVSSPMQLQNVRSRLSAYYKLDNDIDMSSWGNWTPIGNATTKFAGNFDGANYTISNLTITAGTAYSSLFGYSQAGTIANLKLSNISISAGATGNIGALAGYITGGSATNCYATDVTISGGSQVGGLFGYINNSTVNNCGVTGGSVSGTTKGGGFVGEILGATTFELNYAKNITVTTSGDYVGGLIGYYTAPNTSTLKKNYAKGCTVSGKLYVGGLIGYSYISSYYATQLISECYADCTINLIATSNYVGGFAGSLGRTNTVDCFALGSITGTGVGGGYVGGFAGTGYTDNNSAYVSRCFSAVNTTAATPKYGFMAYNTAFTSYHMTVTSCYFDSELAGTTSTAAGTAKTTSQMQTQSTFSGYNFDTIWQMSGYPALQVFITSTPGSEILSMLENVIDMTPGSATLPMNETIIDMIPGSDILPMNVTIKATDTSLLPANERVMTTGTSNLSVNERILTTGSASLPMNVTAQNGDRSRLTVNELIRTNAYSVLPINERAMVMGVDNFPMAERIMGTASATLPMNETIQTTGSANLSTNERVVIWDSRVLPMTEREVAPDLIVTDFPSYQASSNYSLYLDGKQWLSVDPSISRVANLVKTITLQAGRMMYMERITAKENTSYYAQSTVIRIDQYEADGTTLIKRWFQTPTISYPGEGQYSQEHIVRKMIPGLNRDTVIKIYGSNAYILFDVYGSASDLSIENVESRYEMNVNYPEGAGFFQFAYTSSYGKSSIITEASLDNGITWIPVAENQVIIRDINYTKAKLRFKSNVAVSTPISIDSVRINFEDRPTSMLSMSLRVRAQESSTIGLHEGIYIGGIVPLLMREGVLSVTTGTSIIPVSENIRKSGSSIILSKERAVKLGSNTAYIIEYVSSSNMATLKASELIQSDDSASIPIYEYTADEALDVLVRRSIFSKLNK